MSTGQKLWKRAKNVIPGGNMLLSKRAEMYLPEQWPAYFSKAKGCHVWDLDGNEYVDMCIMGVGSRRITSAASWSIWSKRSKTSGWMMPRRNKSLIASTALPMK